MVLSSLGWIASSSVCGDGVIAGTEACDDSNSASLDGCSSACQEESGWTCTGQPSSCSTTCGDGIVTGTEQCEGVVLACTDIGNSMPGITDCVSCQLAASNLCCAAPTWQIEAVDTVGAVGKYSSLALDSAGHAHISYYDESNQTLKHAWFDGAAWQLQVVDSAANVGRYSSLALDSSDRPHIGYRLGVPDNDLKYAWHDGSVWQIEVVAPGLGATSYVSLALDANGQPHISYYAGGELRYARLICP